MSDPQEDLGKNPNSQEDLKKIEEEKLKAEKMKASEARKALLKKKLKNNEIQEFVPKWLLELTEIKAKESSENNQSKVLPVSDEEREILNSLLPMNLIKRKVIEINAETNFNEIQRIYNMEMEKNEEIFAKLKKIVTKNQNSILNERRGPLIGMRTVALKKGLTVEQIQKNLPQLEETECFEVFYFCLLFQKYTIYQKQSDKPEKKQFETEEEEEIEFKTSQDFKNKIWFEFKKAFFYDNINYLHHLEYEMEDYKEEIKPKKERQQVAEIIEEDAKKFKPTVWNPEEVVDVESIRGNMNEEKVRIFDETKEPLVMIFIGHVDSGKSTICGSILQLSGLVNDLEVTKLRQEAKGKGMESWYNAYVMDVIDEEKETGKTIEMGRAYFETKKKRFTILDCPGHKNFVQAMLSGAAQADIASLVISAKPGEFESGFEKEGQTREHAMLARSLGADYVVVLINKMDTVNWNKERYDYIKNNLTPFLEINCGFNPKNIYWTILAGLHQINMVEPVKSPSAEWYTGSTLFKTFDDMPCIKRSQNKILRIPLLDKFKDMGAIISSCKINSGIVKPNMTCILMPIQKLITIAKVLDTLDNELAYAGSGESVTLQLKGIEEDEIKRGYVICGQQYWTNVCREFEAEVHVFELMPNQCFGPGFTCMLHLHTALEEVSISSLKRIEESENGVKKVDAINLKSGQRGIVKFKCKNLLCIEKFSDFEDLGRFALRKETITMAAGTILRFKPENPELLKNNNYFVKAEPVVETKREDAVDDIC